MMPTEGEDFTISSDAFLNDQLQFSYEPVQVTVTLLNDGVVGEPEEDIVLTLRQNLDLSPLEDFRVLNNPTIRIAFSDNDGIRCLYVYSCTINAHSVARHAVERLYNGQHWGMEIWPLCIERWP